MLNWILKWMAKLTGKEKPPQFPHTGKRPLPGAVSAPSTYASSEQEVSLSSKPTRFFGLMFSVSWQWCKVYSVFCLSFPQILKRRQFWDFPAMKLQETVLLGGAHFFIKLCNLQRCDISTLFCIKNNPDIHLFSGRGEAENGNLESVAARCRHSFLVWLAMKIWKKTLWFL